MQAIGYGILAGMLIGSTLVFLTEENGQLKSSSFVAMGVSIMSLFAVALIMW